MVEKLSEKAAQRTRDEWRRLGFFYDLSTARKEWHLTGSRVGLSNLVQLLVAYAAKESNQVLGEHEHYGPHLYLTVMTAAAPNIDDHAICGTLSDIARLAGLLRTRLGAAHPGEQISVREEYTPNADYSLVLEVREEDFDPTSLDPQL